MLSPFNRTPLIKISLKALRDKAFAIGTPPTKTTLMVTLDKLRERIPAGNGTLAVIDDHRTPSID